MTALMTGFLNLWTMGR